MTLPPGTRLGDYEVKSLIGAGGMGEVYRAHDSRLGRDVAVKVLPEYVSRDPHRLRRFEQEARAAAALNHPNILAIHQMGMYDGAPYLVSELLDGGTLREQLNRGHPGMRKTVEYAVQMARGLAAAHEKGIVHRDLKPENLFVTRDGRLKILDFGLAKLVRPEGQPEQSVATVAAQTDPGMVLGTAGYMAPEQVRAEAIDHPDIFAFGSILSEMLSGQRAFQKLTAVETMNAILKEEPAGMMALSSTIPLALHRIVQRCLEKNPEQRFQSASDLAFALEALSDAGSSSSADLAGPPKHSRRWMYAAIAASVGLAVVAAVQVLRPRSSLVPTTDWIQLTDFADSVTSPAFSPDGRMLAFLRGDSTFVTAGNVYVMLLPHGTPVRLTNDAMPKMSPVFSLDGSTIAYTVPWETWTVPVLGGQPRRWLPNASGLTWQDADNVIYSQITVGNHMEVVASDRSRANAHSIYSPDQQLGMAHRSYVSPDRKWVIVVEMADGQWERCRLVPFDGSSRGMPIGPADGACTAAGWSGDGAWMYLNSSAGGVFHIWRERFSDHRLEQVTAGPTQEEGIAIAPDAQSLVTAVGLQRSSVWLHDSHGERALTSEATASLADARNGSPFSRDATKLYYLVRRGAMRDVSPDTATGELSELDLRSGATQALLPGFSISEFSQSPDGREIVFGALDDQGASNIWLTALDRSSSPRKLMAQAHRARFAAGFIYYIKRTAAGSYVHRMRPDGSGDEQVWDEKVVSLATSPDGRYLAATVPISKNGEWMLEIVDWARKHVQPVCIDAIGYWSDDGRSFLVSGGIGKANKSAVTYVVPLASADAVPDLPPAGLPDIAQLATLSHASVVPHRIIGIGPDPDTYAFVKETTQRNLYRVPLH